MTYRKRESEHLTPFRLLLTLSTLISWIILSGQDSPADSFPQSPLITLARRFLWPRLCYFCRHEWIGKWKRDRNIVRGETLSDIRSFEQNVVAHVVTYGVVTRVLDRVSSTSSLQKVHLVIYFFSWQTRLSRTQFKVSEIRVSLKSFSISNWTEDVCEFGVVLYRKLLKENSLRV